VPKPTKSTRKRNRRNDAIGWFGTAVVWLYIAWMVAGPGNVNWNDDAWWPLFVVIAALHGLAGVRSLALWVRERQAADTGQGTA
jgi:hypothetical protein